MARNPITIRNADEFRAAHVRANELAGGKNGSDEERELEAIVEAVEAYKDALRIQQNLSKGEEPEIARRWIAAPADVPALI